MNGIYFCEGFNIDEKNGITNKINSQINCLKEICDLNVVAINNSYSFVDKILFFLPFISSKREKQREKILLEIDKNTTFIYIRKPTLTIKFVKILKKIKKNNPKIKIFIEIPTYPFHNEYSGLSKLYVLKSINAEKKIKKYVDYILTYSDDKVIWGIPCINISNCVDYEKIDQKKNNNLLSKTIRLITVASFMYWHGVDRLLLGLKKYNGDYNFIINIVGEGQEINNLKQIANGDSRIIFHGKKFGNELTDVFNESDIAVDALGRHRSGVYYNSSLKGKEYVARGLPIISSVRTELDNYKDYPYYLKVSSDDSPIDFSEIVKFYEKIYLSNVSPTDISNYIRDFSYKKFDYKYGFLEVIKRKLNGVK